MKFENLFKRLKPHFTYNGNIIFSKNNKIIELSKDQSKKIILEFKISLLEKLLFHSKYLSRLFRLGIRSSINYENIFFFSFQKKIYSFDIKKNFLNIEHKFRFGRGPLSYTVIDNIESFEDGIVFGEYFGNNPRNEVHIYKRNKKSEWEIIYTFKKGLINHIHSIVPDKFRNCLWIFAGDFGHSSSIWKVEANFNKVERVLFGKQVYRACFGYPTKEGLIYATDTQFEGNSIRILKINSDTLKSEELYKINGTCVYGANLKDYLVFSTCTEPIHHPNNKFLLFFDNRPGPGIIKNKSDIIIFKKKDRSFKVISSFEKDFLPYGLFGLGSIIFPSGLENSNFLYAFLSGSKQYDQDSIGFDLEKLKNDL